MATAMGDTEGDLVAASGESDGWKLGERAPRPADESGPMLSSCEMGERVERCVCRWLVCGFLATAASPYGCGAGTEEGEGKPRCGKAAFILKHFMTSL